MLGFTRTEIVIGASIACFFVGVVMEASFGAAFFFTGLLVLIGAFIAWILEQK